MQFVILFAALVAAPLASSEKKSLPEVSSTDQTAITKLQADWTSAWNKHQPEGLAAVFSETGDLMNPMGRAAKGRAQITQLFQEEHAGRLKESTFSSTCEAARPLATDVAEVDCAYKVEGIKGSDPVSGHVTNVVVRSSDGWKVASHRAMIPMVLATAPKDPAHAAASAPR